MKPPKEVILAARKEWAIASGPFMGSHRVAHLETDHFLKFVDWMMEGKPWHEIVSRMKCELSLPANKVPGRTAQSDAWAEFSRILYKVWSSVSESNDPLVRLRSAARLLLQGAKEFAPFDAEFSERLQRDVSLAVTTQLVQIGQ